VPAVQAGSPKTVADDAIVRRIGRVRPRHEQPLRQIVFAPDGRVFATRTDETLRWWDVQTGACVRTIVALDGGRFVFSPDGKILAVASTDKVIRLWETATGRPLRALVGHRDEVTSLDFGPGGRLASGGYDGELRLWHTTRGTLLRMLAGPQGEVHAVSFAPDGKSVAAASADRKIRRWQCATGKLLQVIETAGGMRALGHSPDGARLAGLLESTLWVWNLASGKPLAAFDGLAYVESAVFSGDSKQLALGRRTRLELWDLLAGKLIRSVTAPGVSGSTVHRTNAGQLLGTLRGKAGSRLDVWDLRSGKRVRRIPQETGVVALSPDGALVVLDKPAQLDLLVIALKTGKLQARFRGEPSIAELCMSPDGAAFAVGAGGQLALHDMTSDRATRRIVAQEHVMALAFGPAGRLLASGWRQALRLRALRPARADPVIERLIGRLGARRFKVRAAAQRKLDSLGPALLAHLTRPRKPSELEVRARLRKMRSRLERAVPHMSFVTSVAFSPDGRRILSTCRECRLPLWDGLRTRWLFSKGKPLSAAAFSQDGRLLAAAGKAVWLFTVKSGLQTRRIPLTAPAHCVSFSPDGRSLAWGGKPGITQYNIATGQRRRLRTGGDLVSCLAYAPDGKHLAAGSPGGNVWLWDAAGKLVALYRGHGGQVTGVAFSPDSQQLLSGSADGCIIFWKLPKK